MKKVPQAVEVFSHAFKFHSAANYLRRKDDNPSFGFYAFPCIHLTCIASELYLKSWLIHTKGQRIEGHNPFFIYRQLDEPERIRISKAWKAETEKEMYRRLPEALRSRLPDLGLETLMFQGNYMFLKSRYWFEDGLGDDNSAFLLGALPDVLFVYITAAMPAWRPHMVDREGRTLGPDAVP